MFRILSHDSTVALQCCKANDLMNRHPCQAPLETVVTTSTSGSSRDRTGSGTELAFPHVLIELDFISTLRLFRFTSISYSGIVLAINVACASVRSNIHAAMLLTRSTGNMWSKTKVQWNRF